jgi:hypothetical protein
VVDLLDDWVRRDAPRLDADNDGNYDEPGPAIMDATWRPIANAVMGRVLGDLLDDVNSVRGLGGLAGESYVDKDLRTLLRHRVKDRFNLRYCGEGSLRVCRDSLWIAVHRAADDLAARLGEPDPAKWLETAGRTGFQPGLIPNTMRSTNRPTFQQVLELQRPWGWWR